jgi:hypothetical protein
MPRIAHGAAWAAALAALWVYATTLSPTVTWRNMGEDSGDLLVASATLGIPHPTGYPLFVLLGRVASFLPLGNLAFRINLVSALAGAAGVYFLARLVLEAAPRSAGLAGATLAATGAALLYAFSRGAWSQSVLAEVYTLNVALLGAILWSLARAARSGTDAPVALSAYLFGVGLSNHLLILAAAPALAVVIAQRIASRSIGPAGAVLLLLFAFWGATLDLYLPIRAARGPEFSWGVPSTPERLAWVLTGAQYAGNFFHRSASQVAAHLVPGRWGIDFGWGLLFLGLGAAGTLAACVSAAAEGARPRGLLPVAVSLTGALALLSAYSIPDDAGYWMPVGYLACAVAGVGAAGLWARAAGTPPLRWGLAALAALGLGTQIASSYREVDASRDVTPYVYAHRNLETVEPNALIVSEYDGRTFALWFYKATDFKRSHPDLVVAYKYLLAWPWYLHHLARRYPSLSVPPPSRDLDLTMNRLVARNVRKRPVYLVRDDPGLASIFQVRPVGYAPIPLYRVGLKSP